jgi:hypothetical protein
MASPITSWIPETGAERRAVEEQMERILAHPVFRSSKRCAALLRHVVQSMLHGQGGLLKERTLGIEVFGREANYETNLDPVVRTTAGEVRKRIAQYYHEAGHETEIRIDLPAGSYLPEFHLPTELSYGFAAAMPMASPVSIRQSVPPPAKRSFRMAYLLSAVACLLVAAVAIPAWMPESAIDSLWGPVLSTSSSALIVIGEPPHLQIATSASPSVAAHMTSGDHVAFADAVSLSRLTGFLGMHGKSYSLQSAQATSFTDLQRGPTVLIAGLDNPWTRRVTDPLRFHFAHGSDPNLYWIEDRNNPSSRDWMVDYGMQYSNLTQDYALVARFLSPETGQMTVVAAGIGDNGTAVAGEFLTNSKYVDALVRAVPKKWRSKNLEAVIATQLIDGKSGPPRVLAVETW